MSRQAEPAPERNHDPVDQAWRIHSAIVTWTSGVDSKASFALAIESAMAAGVIAMSGGDRALSHMEDWFAQWAYWLGVASLAIGLLSVALVVRPRLRTRHANHHQADENFIYFGHARHWHPEQLETALRERDMLPILTRQVVAMSEIAWLKHRLLQVSLTAAALSAALLAVAAYVTTHV